MIFRVLSTAVMWTVHENISNCICNFMDTCFNVLIVHLILFKCLHFYSYGKVKWVFPLHAKQLVIVRLINVNMLQIENTFLTCKPSLHLCFLRIKWNWIEFVSHNVIWLILFAWNLQISPFSKNRLALRTSVNNCNVYINQLF